MKWNKMAVWVLWFPKGLKNRIWGFKWSWWIKGVFISCSFVVKWTCELYFPFPQLLLIKDRVSAYTCSSSSSIVHFTDFTFGFAFFCTSPYSSIEMYFVLFFLLLFCFSELFFFKCAQHYVSINSGKYFFSLQCVTWTTYSNLQG